MIHDWLIDRVYFDWCYSYTCTLGTGLSVWRLCCRLWHRGLSLWRPAVPPVYAESSHWQLLSVLVSVPHEYICHQIVARADMFMSFMFCFTIINDWLVDLLYFDECQSEICILGTGLSVWWPWCRLWCRWLSLWLPAVPPVDAGSSHWQHLSVLVFIPYEYWSSLFQLILLIYMYTEDGAVGVTTMSSLVAPRVVLVTACGATGRCRVVTLTAPLCFSVYTVRILIVLISINSTHIHVHWGWGCRCDDYVVACGAAGCTCDSLRCRR